MTGYEADPDEVFAIVDLAIEMEDMADPTLLYIQASKRATLHEAAAVRMHDLRAEALQRLADDGMTVRAIAGHVGLSGTRVQQLLTRAKAEL